MAAAKSWKGWKAVNMSSLQRGTGGGLPATFQTENSISWYNRMMSNPGKRREVLKRQDLMDYSINISRALDIIAEDISSDNIETDDNFIVDFDPDETIQKSAIKTIQQCKLYWKERTGFDIDFFEYVREMLKYGAVFFLINEDFSLTKLVPQRLEGYVLDQDDDSKVACYLYNENATYKNEEGDDIAATSNSQASVRKIPVNDLLILKIGRGPFGESILDRAYRTWRHIQLIEDAIIIYRIIRAPERRVWTIDVGRMSGIRAEAHIERIKLKMRQRQVTNANNSSVDSEYNPQALWQDYFVAKNSDGRGSSVETLPGGQNLDQIKDLVYFNKQLAVGLRIPTSYMQSPYDDGAQPAQYNDGRVGTAYIEELRYAGYIQRIQKKITKPLFEHFKRYGGHIGVKFPTVGMTFKIAEPQSFALYRQNDLYNTLLNTAVSANSLDYVSKKVILEKFLHLSTEDIVDNEVAVLVERGFTEDEIDELTEDQRGLLVYGKGIEMRDAKGKLKDIMTPAEAEAYKADTDAERNAV